MKNYNTIVISGGALKGFAILGCLQYLEDKKKIQDIKKFIGTSVGAIISYLLCIGYTPIEIMVYLCKNNWMEKMSNLDIIRAFYNGGATSFSIVGELLEKLTIEKIGKLITLEELLEISGKQLICCTFNLTKQEMEFMNPIDNPKLPCIVALRMTSNLPFLFEPFLYDSYYYLDGCIMTNFPISKVDLKEDNAIGIKFTKYTIDMKDISCIQYLYELLILPSKVLEKHLNKENIDKCDIIEINVDNIWSLNFNMSMNDRLEMFSVGYDTAKKYIENIKE